MSLSLLELLFEETAVTDQTLVSEFASALKSGRFRGNKTSQAIIYALDGRGANVAEVSRRFVDQIKPQILQAIGAEAVSFTFLGAGQIGLAFNVINSDDDEFVFKIESTNLENYRQYSALQKWQPAIKAQNTGGVTGKSQPRIYDSGMFEVQPYGVTRKTEAPSKFNWFLMQKLETEVSLSAFESALEPVFRFMEEITKRFQLQREEKALARLGVPLKDVQRKGVVKALADVMRSNMSGKDYFRISSTLRLAPDWLESLVKDSLDYAKDKITSDFHIGNVGIERKGAEGYLKFFD